MVPQAIILTMFVLILIYLGLAVVGLSVVSPEEFGTRYMQDPVTEIVGRLPVGGSILQPWIAVLAAIALFVAANAGLIGASCFSFN